MSDSTKKLGMDELDKIAGGQITSDEALSAALKHARKKKDQVRVKKSKLDREHGRMVYEVEFVAGEMEYEYDIDAETGKVLKFEKDYWD